jgi:Zn-dependent oligopeptidase
MAMAIDHLSQLNDKVKLFQELRDILERVKSDNLDTSQMKVIMPHH